MRQVQFFIGMVLSSLLSVAPVHAAGDKSSDSAVLTLEASMRDNTAKALGCPAAKVTVKKMGVSNGRARYVATGCGSDVHYLMSKEELPVICPCSKHCPVGPGSPGGGTTCCEWKCP